MNLELILYFALGFLAAALLALMVVPAIWNRAVVLTKRRIESSVPLTMNEIQAEKDQLRAEFAMSTRRLEMTVDELKEKASAQLIEINRKRDDVNKLDVESKKRLGDLEKLEQKHEDMGRLLEDKESAYELMKERNDELELRNKHLASEIQSLQSEGEETRDLLKIKEAEVSANKTALKTLNAKKSGSTADVNKLVKEIERLQNQLDSEREKYTQLRAESNKQKKDLSDAKKEIQQTTKNAGKSRKEASDGNTQISDLNSRLLDEQARNVELEAKLAKNMLQTEALLSNASNENVQAIVKSLRGELEEKADVVRSLQNEKNRLSDELEAAQTAVNQDWSEERQEKALLRERINDLAAQVAVMTANLEGDDSPVNKILADDKLSASRSKKSSSVSTLAERIRAIQAEANS